MASRKEQKERLRQERLERERAAAAATARRKRTGYAVAGLLVLAVIIAVVAIAAAGGGGSGKASTSDAGWPSGSIPKRKETDLAVAAKVAGCTLQNPPSQGRGHVLGHVNYKTSPPTSGPHNPVWAHDGAYRSNPPGLEHLVHPLEHGRVIIWFKPSAPLRVIGDLKKLYDEDPNLMIISPYERPMKYQVAATAWTHLLGCPSYNDRVPDAIRAFRDQYRLKGPEYIPNAE